MERFRGPRIQYSKAGGLGSTQKVLEGWNLALPELAGPPRRSGGSEAKIARGDRDAFDESFRADWASVDALIMRRVETAKAG